MSFTPEEKGAAAAAVHSESAASAPSAPAAKRRFPRALRRGLAGLLILASFAWLYTAIFWPSDLLALPEIHAHLAAKEVCSCVFVEELAPEECARIHRKLFDPSSLRVDRERGTVSARTFYAVARARYHGESEGCRFDY